MPLLTTDMLSAVPAALPEGVTAEIEPGGVTCTAKDFSGYSLLPIVIHAPAGATAATVYSYNGKGKTFNAFKGLRGKMTSNV